MRTRSHPCALLGAVAMGAAALTAPSPALAGIAVPDRAGARAVTVAGGDGAQRAMVRDVIARLQASPWVAGVGIAGRAVTVRVRGGSSADPVWRMEVLAREIVFRGRAHGAVRTVTLRYGPVRERIDGAMAPRRASSAAALLSGTRRRAAALGVRLRRVTAFPIRTGAVAIDAEMTPAQMLADSTARTASGLAPGGDAPSWTLAIRAVNGVLVVRSGHAFNYGFVGARFLGAVASPPLPAGLVGPTRLTITFRRVSLSAADPGSTTAAVLDCDGGASSGVADPAVACAALTTHWLRYLPPTEGVYSGPLADSVSITGTVRGIAVDRFGPGCTGIDRSTWAALVSARPTVGGQP